MVESDTKTVGVVKRISVLLLLDDNSNDWISCFRYIVSANKVLCFVSKRHWSPLLPNERGNTSTSVGRQNKMQGTSRKQVLVFYEEHSTSDGLLSYVTCLLQPRIKIKIPNLLYFCAQHEIMRSWCSCNSIAPIIYHYHIEVLLLVERMV